MTTVTGPAQDQFDTWLEGEVERLARFAERSRHPRGGFGWLDSGGRIDAARPVETWITARMTYVFSLAHLRGRRGAEEFADHGVTALVGLLRDEEFGGWFPSDPRAGVVDEKRAYDHAFVALTAATAALAGRPGAQTLLGDVLECIEQRFWDEDAGLSVDVWDRGWTRLEPYRGANANMHMTEAFLTVADATGQSVWLSRALGIAERLIETAARGHGWRLPEHFDVEWQALPDYNRENPAHPFRPYGATVGHWFEWARLLGHLHLALPDPARWLLADARALFTSGVREGWAVDGADGFVYTVDWDGAPVVRERMHWVVTEAIAAAAFLHKVTGDDEYARWLPVWWQYASRFLVDTENGGWHHELDDANRPSSTVWSGKPDVYHAFQAALICLAPPAPSVAAAVQPRAV